MQLLNHANVSPEQRQAVFTEIAAGSELRPSFYALVTISTVIAAFGLLSNSTAIVIGAMLVAPLMTPIFGMAFHLVIRSLLSKDTDDKGLVFVTKEQKLPLPQVNTQAWFLSESNRLISEQLAQVPGARLIDVGSGGYLLSLDENLFREE